MIRRLRSERSNPPGWPAGLKLEKIAPCEVQVTPSGELKNRGRAVVEGDPVALADPLGVEAARRLDPEGRGARRDQGSGCVSEAQASAAATDSASPTLRTAPVCPAMAALPRNDGLRHSRGRVPEQVIDAEELGHEACAGVGLLGGEQGVAQAFVLAAGEGGHERAVVLVRRAVERQA